MKIFKIMLIALFAISILSVNAQPKIKAERPYTILERGQHMTRLNIIKDVRAKENTVQIEAVNASGGTLRVQGPEMLGADITDVLATIGNYNKIQEISKSGRGETIQLQQVVFPLKVRITISNQVLEVMFKEEGFWKITVGMNQ
ncbi:MAG: hypothetical protein B7X86_11040 [Sphingobacteriales bacterium 17-39-43]|uniref:hypothetical protein n=1 Tax=Daejeonella sp. TaxID=2805397 RepID=UPI000BC81B00|nr:hypothetical protein [Daejeonella sp.]OYX93219.1 MAG: hypothetical protein B7Y76_12025 [Sphingobacteriia bacterium 35-40-5]OYZ30988.1 MAG: hypothetical protein B7Y24_11105 [Sphingobacteriales bacterium 16-39-50]OZA23785.1 MAG: hypothetical protein B7X86_11040 [Sphingobacteriales bacterium 17-39-43]HQS52332.1 hypothetical protein [Daejeonella sp.]HQT22758.1 hypothetical protein [Daejeonella sp.]